MPARAPKGRSVVSEPGQGAAGATDGYERAKDFLTATELATLLEAAKAGRHGTRDHLLLMMMSRHGLRVSEAVGLCLDELDLDRSMLWVHRLKGGLSVQQPIAGNELAPSGATPPCGRAICPGCSSPSAESRSPGRPSATSWASPPSASACQASTAHAPLFPSAPEQIREFIVSSDLTTIL